MGLASDHEVGFRVMVSAGGYKPSRRNVTRSLRRAEEVVGLGSEQARMVRDSYVREVEAVTRDVSSASALASMILAISAVGLSVFALLTDLTPDLLVQMLAVAGIIFAVGALYALIASLRLFQLDRKATRLSYEILAVEYLLDQGRLAAEARAAEKSRRWWRRK